MKKKKALILTLITAFAVMCFPSGVFAAALPVEPNVITIDDVDTFVSPEAKLKLSYENAEIKWKDGIGGKMKVSSGGWKMYCLPILSDDEFIYIDPVNIRFKNAGEIAGKSIDVNIHVNSIKASEKQGDSKGEDPDGYFCFMCFIPSNQADNYGDFDFGCPKGGKTEYMALYEIDVTFEIVYSDDGSDVPFTFFQVIRDIDSGYTDTYYQEGWEPISGYTNDRYIYPDNYLKRDGQKWYAPGETSSDLTNGDDTILVSGLYATTTSNEFRSKFYEGVCVTAVEIYSQYDLIDGPKVEATKGAKPGEEVTITTTQKMGKFYYDTLNKYGSFIMSDTLPKGISYKDAKVTDSHGNDLTKYGKLTFDEKTNTVTFTFNESWLNSQDNYDGRYITMTVRGTVDRRQTTATLINISRTTIDSLSWQTDSPIEITLPNFNVTVPMQLPIHVDAAGNKTYADNAEITNNSEGAVEVSGIDLKAKNGWTAVSYGVNEDTLKVDSKQFAIKLNGDKTDSSGKFTFNEKNWSVIPKGESLAVDYEAKVSCQSEPVSNEGIADIIFTVQWKDGLVPTV